MSNIFFRKSSTENEVISQAKSLIKMWKKFVPDSGEKKEKKEKDSSNNGKEKSDNEKESSKKIGDKALPPKASATTDDVRLGCRRLLATALRGLFIYRRVQYFTHTFSKALQ